MLSCLLLMFGQVQLRTNIDWFPGTRTHLKTTGTLLNTFHVWPVANKTGL